MSDDSGDLRGRWAAVRFGLLGVIAVCILIAYTLASGGGPVMTTVAVVATLAALAAALWDAGFLRRRNQRVLAGVEQKRFLDPLEQFMPVFAFALLTAIVDASLSEVGPLRWVLLAVCLVAAAISYGSYRHYKDVGEGS